MYYRLYYPLLRPIGENNSSENGVFFYNRLIVENTWEMSVKNKPKVRATGEDVWERAALFEIYIIPALGSLLISELTRKDAMAMHRSIAPKHGETNADRCVEALRAAINWLYDQELVEAVPHLRFKSNKVRRDRVLTADEIKSVWQTLAGANDLFAAVIKMLLLTGQRRFTADGYASK